MEKKDLRARVEARIQYWTAELGDLPDEYTESARQRLLYVNEVLVGLHEILNKFCSPPEPRCDGWDGVLY